MKVSEVFTPNLLSLIDQIDDKCASCPKQKDLPNDYDFYENFNKYVFALQNARDILKEVLEK